MRDLAPDIVRQRILIEGFYTRPIDEDVIREFFGDITKRLALRTYDLPVVFAPGGEGREDNEGYDAFVPLIDSGISLYVWTGPKFLSVVAFTCKAFDAATAVTATREFFAMTDLEHSSFLVASRLRDSVVTTRGRAPTPAMGSHVSVGWPPVSRTEHEAAIRGSRVDQSRN